MINVFFVPGTFGTTIEYVIRNYTKEYAKIEAEVLDDGSMHSFKKEFHPFSTEALQHIPNSLDEQSISTPIYPFKELGLLDIISQYDYNNITGPRILLYCDSFRSAELNCLFQYHKICCGVRDMGLGFYFDGATNAVTQWNPSYQSWVDMQRWELREWFSFLYPKWVSEWLGSEHVVTDSWLTVSNSEILTEPAKAFLKIINFCHLTLDGDIRAFADHWLEKQRYILDEFNLLDSIISCTISNQELHWQPLNVIAESILQQRLRTLNFELMCDGLNTFPTTSEQLHKLLIKV